MVRQGRRITRADNTRGNIYHAYCFAHSGVPRRGGHQRPHARRHPCLRSRKVRGFPGPRCVASIDRQQLGRARSRSSVLSSLPMWLRGISSIASKAASRWVLPSLPLVSVMIEVTAASGVSGCSRTKPTGVSPHAPARHSHHRRLGHARIGLQHRFQIAREDVEPARDDHVLGAADQFDEAVGVDPPDIAHPLPLFAGRGIGPVAFARLAGLVLVARHHRARPADEIARACPAATASSSSSSTLSSLPGAGRPTVWSLSGNSCARRMQTTPPSVIE